MIQQPSLWDREPAAFLSLVSAAISLITSFGFSLSGEQVGAVMAFTAVVVGFITRSKVSPVDTSGMFVKRKPF
jgi:hypothetical protein